MNLKNNCKKNWAKMINLSHSILHPFKNLKHPLLKSNTVKSWIWSKTSTWVLFKTSFNFKKMRPTKELVASCSLFPRKCFSYLNKRSWPCKKNRLSCAKQRMQGELRLLGRNRTKQKRKSLKWTMPAAKWTIVTW